MQTAPGTFFHLDRPTLVLIMNCLVSRFYMNGAETYSKGTSHGREYEQRMGM
jgi:hypothetical protein